jgi:hypothetical protein
MSPIAAQAFELLFLQYAQELRLQCRRNVAHLIQEERAFVGQFKTADLLRDCPGERTSLVAKQAHFPADPKEWQRNSASRKAPSSRAGVVNCARDEFLAGACLALDQYGRIRRRDVFDLFEHPFQRRTAAYDLLKSTWGRVSITTIEHLGRYPLRPPAFLVSHLIIVLH